MIYRASSLPDTTGFSEPVLRVRVDRIILVRRIKILELVDPAGAPLPPFEPGAHIRVQLPSGLERRYSLCGDSLDSTRYTIAVLREDAGAGGSVELHQRVGVGDEITVSAPVNEFPLRRHDGPRLFIAGGIGITAVWPMVERTWKQRGPFSFIYCVKGREHALFCGDLDVLERQGLATVHESGSGEKRLDLSAIVAGAKAATHIYCCGPRGMMEVVRAAALKRADLSTFFEAFSEAPKTVSTPGRAAAVAGEVVLRSTGERFEVPAGATILETLERHGVKVPSSCRAGTCGTCKTRYLKGFPVHEDFVLNEDEHRQFVMVCVSKCGDEPLVLAL